MSAELRCLVALALLMTGCATVPSVADREFAAGNYGAAAAAYEEALRTEPKARANPALGLRLGLAYAQPGTPAHDPARAATVLRDLVSRFPKTPEAAQASVLIPQLDHEAELVSAATAATAEIAQLREALERARKEAQALDAAIRTGMQQIENLRAVLATREAELKRVRTELEQLKRIDLQRAP